MEDNLHAINNRFYHERLLGPWKCEACGRLSQFAVVTTLVNRVFCRNENCDFHRFIDKQRARVVESDGTVWAYDAVGNKRRVRG